MRRIGLAVVLTFGLGLVAAPLVHEAHAAGQVPRVGILETGAPSASEYWPAFHQRLRELGYAEGQTITFESRSAGGRNERLPDLAVELVGLKVDIIVTTGTPAAVAAKQATATIPIVMAVATDPVGAGLTASLGRPGGNVTGLANLDAELSGKRLEMLKGGGSGALPCRDPLESRQSCARAGVAGHRGRGPRAGRAASTGGSAKSR
jgi:putative ABC transport system substrate-binding protein